jgi:lipoate-protein ligase A
MDHSRGLKVVEFGCNDAGHNMALDWHLFASCEQDPRDAFVRFYTWCPSALSLGFFECPDAIDHSRAQREGIQIVKRPTGGRVVLHKEDLTYTIVLPRKPGATGSETYIMVSNCIVDGLISLGAKVEMARGSPARSASRTKPCFLSAARHEIIHAGRKVVGSAQRMGRNAVLQHGSIPLGRGYLEVVNYLSCGEDEKQSLISDMKAATTCLEDIVGREVEPSTVASALLDAFAGRFGGPVRYVPDHAHADEISPNAPRLGGANRA